MYFGFDNISIAYGKKSILEGVSMEFEQGKITTIIGPNGCGKSSLLKTVSRTLTPSAGRVVYQDRALNSYTPKELARQIAYLPQNHISPSDIDIRTLVSYGRYPHKRPGRGLTQEDKRIIDETLELTGLTSLADRLLNNLSGGERQRAWIAMTICQQPQILLLDEPITYLDVGYQVEVLELIRDLREKLNITIIMVLHDMNFTARYSDRIYMLKNRKIYGYGDAETMICRENMQNVFHVDAQVFQDAKNICPYMLPEKLKQQMSSEHKMCF